MHGSTLHPQSRGSPAWPPRPRCSPSSRWSSWSAASSCRAACPAPRSLPQDRPTVTIGPRAEGTMDAGDADILSRYQVRRHRWTVAEYRRMAEAGILAEDDRVELLEGQLVDMSPIGPRHALAVDTL